MEGYEGVYQYLAHGTYPTGFCKNQKRMLRRKCQENFSVKKGLLYYSSTTRSSGRPQSWRQVPRWIDDIQRILESCHSSLEGGHLSRDKTYQKISSRFYWKTLWNDVQTFVQTCDTCQRTNDAKFNKKTAPLHPILVQPKVWNQIGLEPLPKTKYGNRFIITLVDFFSKWPEAAPLPDKSAKSVALFLYQMLCRYGYTKVVISDQGREFVNKVSCCLFELTQTEHRISSAYHPQTNGLVERFNQSLQRSLVKVVNDNQTDWDEKLDGVLFAYRTAPQQSTKYTPFELMYCRKAVLPIEIDQHHEVSSHCDSDDSDDDSVDGYVQRIYKFRDNLFNDAKENIKTAQMKQKKEYDKKHCRKKQLQVGSLVLVRNSARDSRKGDKLRKRWLGPK